MNCDYCGKKLGVARYNCNEIRGEQINGNHVTMADEYFSFCDKECFDKWAYERDKGDV